MALCLKACGEMGSDTDRCVQFYVFNTACYGFCVLDHVRVPQSYVLLCLFVCQGSQTTRAGGKQSGVVRPDVVELVLSV